MSQRRGGGAREIPASAEEVVPFSQSIEDPAEVGTLSLDGNDDEPVEKKEDSWREGHFATGKYEATWKEEYERFRRNPWQECVNSADDDGVPCLCCSAVACGYLGAGRVGNMAVLKQSVESLEEVTDEGDGSEPKVRRIQRPRLDIVVGPYWPMLMCVTYPMILGMSGATLLTAIPGKPFPIQMIWGICTGGLIYALAMTAFRDPGILRRYRDPPPQADARWRWSDRAYTHRPPGAYFDPDTGVVVEGFDHTCPWTGTAIGRRNMPAFQCFVGLVFLCLIFDIILLTGGIR